MLEEYLLDSDPADASSAPVIRIEQGSEAILFPLGDLPDRPDATIAAEGSADLVNWNPVVVTRTELGLEVPRVGEKSYLRLTFSLNE